MDRTGNSLGGLKMSKAERGKERKESGAVHNIFSVLSKPLASCTKWYWEHKIKAELRRIDINNQIIRNRYCSQGFHKLNHNKVKLVHGKRQFSVEFLECPYCGYKFFSTAKDKQKYLRLTSRKRKVFEKAWGKICKETKA